MTEDDDTPSGREALPPEPEQMSLWRRIIAWREDLVRKHDSWLDLIEHQRSDSMRALIRYEEEMREAPAFPEERIAAELARIGAEQREIDELSERQLFRYVEQLRVEIDALDAEVESKSVEGNGRGFRMAQLRALADRQDALDREDVLRWVLAFLEESSPKKRSADEAYARSLRATAEEKLRRRIGHAIDVAELAREARKQLDREDTSKPLTVVAERMLRIAEGGSVYSATP